MVLAREKSATIVVCEGEGRSLDLLCEKLIGNGHGVLAAADATAALRFCRYNDPDLMLLDLALPEGSGVGVLRTIRQADGAETRIDPTLPVIVLIESDGSAERRLGLNLGALDCIERPLDLGDLSACVNAAVGRPLGPTDEPLMIGELLVDPGRHLVKVGDRRVPLTKTEFVLLRVLASEPTRVFSRAELLRDVWDVDGSPTQNDLRKLNGYMSRVRRKLDPEGIRYVLNRWGVGWKLVGE